MSSPGRRVTPSECRAIAAAIEHLVRSGKSLAEARRMVCAAAQRVVARRDGLEAYLEPLPWQSSRIVLEAEKAGFSQAEAPDALSKLRSAADIAPIKAVREAVSPWLWVTSVVGFGLALLNTRRIGLMYKGWRDKRAKRRAV